MARLLPRMWGRPVGVYVIQGDRVAWLPAVDVGRLIAGMQIVAVVALVVYRSVASAQTPTGLTHVGRSSGGQGPLVPRICPFDPTSPRQRRRTLEIETTERSDCMGQMTGCRMT